MFKFKMLTKVLVAVFVLGQLIESNLNLCIAMSIDLGAPAPSVKSHNSWQSSSETPETSSLGPEHYQANSLDTYGGGSPAAGRAPASTTQTEPTTTTNRTHASASTSDNVSSVLSTKLQLTSGDEALQPSSELKGADKRIVQTLESNGKLNYFTTLLVGEQRVPFMVLIDLTTSAFWLPSSECKALYCISRQKYNRLESMSHQDDGRQTGWTYGGNLQAAEVSAKLVRDKILFGGLQIDDQTFGEATEMRGEPFAYLPVDGFLGLGFKELSLQTNSSSSSSPSTGAAASFETPFERLWRMGHLREPIFSLLIKSNVQEYSYSADNGELILGQLADGYEPHELTYVPVTHVDYWEFHLSGVTLRHAIGDMDLEQACESACPAILDAGTSWISGHFTDVDRLNRALGAYPVGNGLYKMTNCDLTLMPNLVFNIGGTEFVLTPEEYATLDQIKGNVLSCYSALRVVSADQYPFWILGEQFLKRHYVVFDYGQKRLGFAKSKSMIVVETEEDIKQRIKRKEHII